MLSVTLRPLGAPCRLGALTRLLGRAVGSFLCYRLYAISIDPKLPDLARG